MRTIFHRRYLYEKYFPAFIQGLIDLAGSALFKSKRQMPAPAGVKKILVSRIDHLGDVFIASSVVPHLKRAYPGAEVHFLAGEWARIALDRNPEITRVHVYSALKHNRSAAAPPAKLWDALVGFVRTARALRVEGYDLSIDLRAYAFNSIPLLALGRAGFKVGFATGGFGFLLDKAVGYRTGVHETVHLSDALAALGIDAPASELRPSYTPTRTAADECTDLLASLGVDPERGYALIHTGAGTPVKLWKRERWEELTRRIKSVYGVEVVAYDRVYGDLNGCKNLPSLVSFDVFAEAARRAMLFVGLDSFPAHLAASFSTPVLVIWCGVNDPVQWAPVGGRVRVVARDVECAPCFMKAGCAGMMCMDISAEECMSEAARLVGPPAGKGTDGEAAATASPEARPAR